MLEIANEITEFLEQNGQSVEVNPTDFWVEGLMCLVVREKKLMVVIRYLSVNYRKNELVNPPDFKSIRLWEDAWMASRNIVESRLLSAIGESLRLPARVTVCRRIDKQTAEAFLEKNHLQGAVKAKLKYGLFLPKRYYRLIENAELIEHENTEMLVAVATFSAAKTYYRSDDLYRSAELIRYANLAKFTVVGGLNKLLKHFETEQNPDDIMTYADADWSDGSTYEKLGFERIEQLSEMAFYVNKTTFKRQRNLPENQFDDFVKVCNSGSWKFIKYLKQTKNE